MKFQIFKVQKERGFRINLLDILFILLLIGASVSIYLYIGDLGHYFLLPLYIGFTFFLFCNVFRLKTKDELLWTLFFMLSTMITMKYFEEHWVIYTLVFSFMLQVILIVKHVYSKKDMKILLKIY